MFNTNSWSKHTDAMWILSGDWNVYVCVCVVRPRAVAAVLCAYYDAMMIVDLNLYYIHLYDDVLHGTFNLPILYTSYGYIWKGALAPDACAQNSFIYMSAVEILQMIYCVNKLKRMI